MLMAIFIEHSDKKVKVYKANVVCIVELVEVYLLVLWPVASPK